MFYPTTCVGFGTGGRSITSGFSWEHGYRRYPIVRGRLVLSSSTSGVYFTAPDISTLFNGLFRQPAVVSLLRPRFAPSPSNGILTVSAIQFALRLPVRSRLTLIRLALIRNPWSSGEGVSRPLYRYLYLHLLFRNLQHGSRHIFIDGGMLPYQSKVTLDSTASAPDLCPIIIHAVSLD